jgi:ABC-2 type transport system permease protein
MWNSATVILRLVGAQVRSQMQYRGSFALQVAGQFFATFVDFISVAVLFHRFPTIDGWSFGEVAFLYGTGAVAFALADLTVGDFERLALMVREGTFDRVMTRPVSAFAQVLAADFQLRRLGRAAQGALVLVIALSMVDIAWSPLKVLVLLAGIASGVVIFACIFVAGAAISFWTLQDSEVLNVFTYGGSELVSYPMTIYGSWLRRFFTFVIPLAFVTYLPALVVLDRSDPFALPRALHFASPLVALLFVVVARGLWSLGLRHYQSTGS